MPSTERPVVKIAPNNQVFDLPVIVGIEEGLFARAGLDVSCDRLKWYVRQREAWLAKHETAEEGEVDAARHLQERVEVGDRRKAAQPTGQTGAAAAA